MDDEIPILEQASLETDAEVLQKVTSLPLEAQTASIPHSKNPNAFIPSVTQLVSSETETNQNAGPSILQSTSSSAKDNKDTDSYMSQLTSPVTETNQDAGQSTSSVTEMNQDDGQSTPSVTETNQDAGQSTPSATETIIQAATSTFELILSVPEMNRNTTQEGASTVDGQQPTMNDAPLPPDPPDYHDIIPLIDDGSNVPPPPPSIFKSLCFCFFDGYRLYYARKIRNSRYMLILLVAFLALPVSAVYMGLKYYDSCSVTPRTPLLLFLMGIVGVLLNILRIFTVISRSFKDLGVCEPPRIISESSVLFILCLMIAEMITFYQNIPVFDDPKNPLYCEELLHTYIFYMNFVVPTIGILALLLHLPMKPVDNTRRRLQEAEREVLRRQQNVESDPSLVYTAWIKPRHRRSQQNEENAEGNDSRFRLNETTEDRDFRSRHNEESTQIRASSSRRAQETTIGGIVGGFQREGGAVSGGIRVHWWDEACTISEGTRNHPWDEEGAVGGPRDDQTFDEEGAVGEAVVGHWGDEEGAVGGAIGVHRWDEGGSECDDFRSLRRSEGETNDLHSRNRESAAFRPRNWEEDVAERTAFRSHRWGEENPEVNLSESRRGDEEGDSLRSRRWTEGIQYGARPKTKETNEGGVRPKRKASARDDINPLPTESVETVVRPLRNESSLGNEAFGTRWDEYGARPKIKENFECVPRSKRKEGTESGAKSKSKTSAEDSSRLKRNESIETADITLQNIEDAVLETFGNQGNVRNEGGVRPKNRVSGTRHKKKKGADSKAKSKQKGNTEDKLKEVAESDDRSKMKGNTQVETEEVAEGGALPKSEDSTERDATPKMKESTESSDRQKTKERTEDDDRL